MNLPVSIAALLAVSTALSPAYAEHKNQMLAEHKTQLPAVTVLGGSESATAPSAETSRIALESIPGSTAVVAQEAYADTRAATIKDMLDFTPGVIAQSRVNEESVCHSRSPARRARASSSGSIAPSRVRLPASNRCG